LTASVTSAIAISSEATAKAAEGVVIVEHFDVQRHRVGEPDDMARNHGDGAELADRAAVAQEHTIEQAPFDVGKGHSPKNLAAVSAEHDCRLLLRRALAVHQRNELAGDEGQRHEQGRERDARNREDELEAVGGQPSAEEALQAEEKHIDETGDNGGDRERHVDERQKKALAAKLELRDRPRGRKAERGVQRHANRGGEDGQADGGTSLRLRQRGEIDPHSLAESLYKHDDQR
jgi:hypothetical protein